MRTDACVMTSVSNRNRATVGHDNDLRLTLAIKISVNDLTKGY